MSVKFHTFIFSFYTVFVAFVSLRPMNGGSIEHWDKLGHFTLYGVFALLGYQLFKHLRHYYALCTGIVIYGGLMEVAQSFMPGRMMSAYDFIANAVGVIIGAVIAGKLLHRD
jgi:VanZ family protein